MRLNNAQIENMFDSDNNDITSVRKFRDALLSSNLVADVYINDHKAFSAPARLAHDSDYLIACVDGRFALSPAVTAENILIKVHYMNGEDTLFQSYTGHLCFPVDDSFGYDADLYFKVLDAVPYNMRKLHVPESSLRKLDSCNFIPINLDEQPGPNPVDPDIPADSSDPVPGSDNAIGSYPEENPTLYVESVKPSDEGEGWVYISNILDDESLSENEVGLNIIICGLGGQEEILCNVRKVYDVEFPDSISAADINSLTDTDRNVKVSDIVVFSGQLNKEDLPEGYSEINIGLRLPEVEEP